ncbi:hypothetical protein ILUMI_20781 [Ignelater luminosus]|uniref:HTH CENPB-type domain-containing protein n=1 Tax=Ignelater luminosus TaxID=2038154 RepID=A0A8K0CDN5_IGNLU|nr:hypothetical protein ILUMI_20781 [Ignelater luminosus]
MVRNYIRKTKRQTWDANVMQTALNEIANGMPFKRASKIFNLPLTTLKRRAKGQNKLAKGNSKHLGRCISTLPEEIETSLKNYALEMEDRLFGLTKKDICKMAYQLAERNGIQHKFSRDKKAAGTAWFKEFLRRNPELSFRTQEATSAARARGFNKEAVAKFFYTLEEIMRVHNITDPMRIYNMDESGIQTVPSKVSKIVAHKGRKQVGFLTSAERGQNISIVLCLNATGQFIPPAIIFPRKRHNDLLYQGLPYGTLCLHNESGYMKSDTFVKFLEHFQKHCQSSVDKKVLLILDGHVTHQTVEAIEYCRSNGIIMLSFPPHCTHEMQPLDVAVFSPLMTYYNEELNLWLKANPGKIVTLYNVGPLFGKAYRRAATLNNGLSGFEKTGIFPYNPNILPDWKFKPSCTTDRPMVASTDHTMTTSNGDLLPTTNCEKNAESQREETPSSQLQKPGHSTMKSKKNFVKAKYETSSSETDEWQASGNSSDDVSIFDENESSVSIVSPSQNNLNENKKIVTPFDISPLPVAPPQSRSSRQSKGATVFTSSPNYLLAKERLSTKMKTSQATNIARKKLFSKTKANKKKRHEEDDAACIFCCELFSTSAAKEKWIKCNSCQKWAHALCAGVSVGKKAYVCDFCV